METAAVKGFVSHGPASPSGSGGRPAVGGGQLANAPKPQLLDRVRQAIRARHYSRRTEDVSVMWINPVRESHVNGSEGCIVSHGVKRFIFLHGCITQRK